MTAARRASFGAAELGMAMVTHYTSTTDVWRRLHDGVEGVAGYRGGDDARSFRIVAPRAVAMDARRGCSFNARQYAELYGLTIPGLMERYGQPTAPSPPAIVSSIGFPPQGEVESIWASCLPVDEVDAASAWVVSRGLSLSGVVSAGVLRAVPRSLVVPRWAYQRGRSWADAFSVVAGLYDAQGALRSLHARRTVVDDGLSKTSSPAGYSVRGLVMADTLGRGLLTGHEHARAHVGRVSVGTGRDGVVIVEGLPAFAAWASDVSDGDEDTPALFGILSGAWTAAHADANPDCARVLVDVDHDESGDMYAKKIIESFRGRPVKMLRMKRPL